MSQQLSHQQLKQIANEFGTPVYVYHAEKIKEQYSRLLAAFMTLIQIFYAPRH
jgi:diaminopimelate decarboxylase